MNSRRKFLGTLGAGVAGALTLGHDTLAKEDAFAQSSSTSRSPSPGAWFLAKSAPWVDRLSRPQYEIWRSRKFMKVEKNNRVTITFSGQNIKLGCGLTLCVLKV